MRIAIIGANAPDSMEWHFADAFQFAGYEAKIFDIYEKFPYTVKRLKHYFQVLDKIGRTYSDSYDRKRFLSVANSINEYNPDLVICFYRDIHPAFVDAVKSKNRRVIHVNPDALTSFGYQQVIAANYDALFTKDPYILEFMKNKAKLNAYIYNEAFNQRYNPKPACTKAEMEKEMNVDVMTYGTLYPYRARMVRALVDEGINVKLYGVVPHRFFDKALEKCYTGKYIVGEEKARTIYGAKIMFNNFHFAEIESVNCRFFEANGCGAFQLCDYKPILKDLLPVDPELVSFKTIDEGAEKVRYYLAHPEERYAIAEKVYQHFLEHYTYDHLIQYILKIVETL